MADAAAVVAVSSSSSSSSSSLRSSSSSSSSSFSLLTRKSSSSSTPCMLQSLRLPHLSSFGFTRCFSFSGSSSSFLPEAPSSLLLSTKTRPSSATSHLTLLSEDIRSGYPAASRPGRAISSITSSAMASVPRAFSSSKSSPKRSRS
ncbi:hypothetical protein CSUI_007207 [Cystoisospora suis]|uniref:Uncharacterized protein n=1 Tax=Cystoisospora suis TaxID=483139 RepID=A0A2C6KRP3_9APIC|nr:hypothetical protein CSUI_007207 [Cystoisospora suis]